ncbi:MAG: hypothetical protein MUF59_11380 [Candidatus Krumholzibacteria bacterium]|nr:hypothetical protein [Candidatus Krumholzibacteria bacterium]
MRKAILAALAILAMAAVPAAVFAAKVIVPEGTEIKVRFDSAAKVDSGKLEKGASVKIVLAEDIKIGGKTIVEKGAGGTAVVEDAVKASRPGDPGKIKITFADLETKGDYKAALNGKIRLAGSVSDEGGGRKIISWIFILGLFIKGGQGEIDTALDYTATIAESIILESN